MSSSHRLSAAALVAALVAPHAAGIEASSPSVVLAQVGEIAALKGSVVHRPGQLYAIEGVLAYSHRAPARPAPMPSDGRLVASHEACAASGPEHPRSQSRWKVAARARGSVASLSNAEILLHRGPALPGLLPYAPLVLELRSAGERIVRAELEPVVFPCEILIDDFTLAPGNEVAVTWLSVAAGYSAGATIFELRQ